MKAFKVNGLPCGHTGQKANPFCDPFDKAKSWCGEYKLPYNVIEETECNIHPVFIDLILY